MRNLKIVSVILLASCFSACTIKERLYMPGYYVHWLGFKSNSPNRNSAGYSMNAYDALSLKPIQEMCIPVSESSEMRCQEGTVIQFPANAFIHQDGSPLRCSKVCVHAWEFYSLSDIIEAGLTTASSGRMIITSGMVYVEATCCGENLKLRPGKQILVKMPVQEEERKTKLFSGKMKNGIVDWTARGNAAADDLDAGNSEYDSSYGVEREMVFEGEYGGADYIMRSGSLGWINCDRFYEMEKKTTLFVKADTGRRTCIALIFRGMKSVLPGYYNEAKVAEFSNIPAGEDVTVLAYRVDEKNKTAIVGTEDITLGDTKKVYLDMREMTLNDFKTFLTQFN